MLHATNDSAQPAETLKSSYGPLVLRNITIDHHRTSMRLESSMWDGLREISRRESLSISEICTWIANWQAQGASLTAAVRAFVFQYFRSAATEEGFANARQIFRADIERVKNEMKAPESGEHGRAFA